VDIHIDERRRKGDEENDDRELVRWKDMSIGIQHGSINYSVLDKALVHIKVNALRIPFRKGRKTRKPRESDFLLFESNGLKMAINLFPKNGFDSSQRGFCFEMFMEGPAIMNEFKRNHGVGKAQSKKVI
jgi:hypothetical protein